MDEAPSVTECQIADFIARHRLPDKARTLIVDHYIPLLRWLAKRKPVDRPLMLGINGAQGSGKSTLADFIRFAFETNAGWRVAVLSLDDFYLTKKERDELGKNVHPLLATRGVPGTHDVHMVAACLKDLRNLAAGEEMPLPRFDKALDDRADPAGWPIVTGPVDLIVLEGWCVGSEPQRDSELATPINALERERDPTGEWRRYANEQLKGPYADLFAQLDLLVFLQVPGFDAVYRWRLEQERKLADSASGSGIMDSGQVADFIRYFERITRANLQALPAVADAVLRLDENHDCTGSTFSTHRSNSL